MQLCKTKVVWGRNIVSVSITFSLKSFEGRIFFFPFFLFLKREKSDFTLLQKTRVLLLNILSKQLQSFPFTKRSVTQYCQLRQTISSSPSKYCFALYCRHLQKVPEMTLKNPPFRSVHFDLTLFTQFFLVQKVCEKSTRREKKKPKATKVFATFLEGSTIAFLFLFKRRSVFYDGMKSEANEMTNGRNI